MAAFILLAFVVVPVVELVVIVKVGQTIGAWETVGLLVGVAVLGSWLVKREGVRAWRAFVAATREHRVPAREVADGALVLFGGALLLTPGFVTDVLGLFLVLPPTRALVRKAFVGFVARRFTVVDVARDVHRRRVVEGERIDPPRH